MKRFLLTLAAVLLTATAADAGPVINGFREVRTNVQEWRAERKAARACQTGHCQPQPQYTPGPVQTAAGTVLVQAGQVVQAAGVAVQSVQVPTFRPSNCQQCVGGVCR